MSAVCAAEVQLVARGKGVSSEMLNESANEEVARPAEVTDAETCEEELVAEERRESSKKCSLSELFACCRAN